MTREHLVLEAAKRLGYDCSKLDANTEQKMIACRHGHGKRTPCCSISITKNLVKCFSCGESGKLTSMFFEQFGHSISRELNLNPSFINNPFTQKYEPPDFEQIPEINFTFSGTLIPINHHKPAADYIIKRGVSFDIANDMGIKYAVRARSVLNTDKKDITYFTDRIIIPIYEKKLMSVEGRDIHGEEIFKQKAKELNFDPNNYRKCLYPKGASTSTLFQLSKLNQNETLYLTEGLMDLAVLRTDKTFKNSSTIFGASVAQRQLYLLSKFKDVVYINNNDEAGWRSVLKIFKYREGDLRILVPPTKCVDIGDIVTELNSTVIECVNRKWLSRIYKPTEKHILEKIAEHS